AYSPFPGRRYTPASGTIVAVIAVSGTMIQSTPAAPRWSPARRAPARLRSSTPAPAALQCSGQPAARLASCTREPRAQHGDRADAAPRADPTHDAPPRGPGPRGRHL